MGFTEILAGAGKPLPSVTLNDLQAFADSLAAPPPATDQAVPRLGER